MHIDSQSGGDDSVEVCPLRINEKAPTKSRGCQYADLCSRARRAEARGAVRTPALRWRLTSRAYLRQEARGWGTSLKFTTARLFLLRLLPSPASRGLACRDGERLK
jgi:hypothetical protein